MPWVIGAPAPHLRAVLWHLLPSALSGLACLESEMANGTTSNRRYRLPWFWGGGALVWDSCPTPKTLIRRIDLAKDFVSFIQAQVVLSSQGLGAPIKGSSFGTEQKASVKATRQFAGLFAEFDVLL